MRIRITLDDLDGAQDPATPYTLNVYADAPDGTPDHEPIEVGASGGALLGNDIPTMLRTLADTWNTMDIPERAEIAPNHAFGTDDGLRDAYNAAHARDARRWDDLTDDDRQRFEREVGRQGRRINHIAQILSEHENTPWASAAEEDRDHFRVAAIKALLTDGQHLNRAITNATPDVSTWWVDGHFIAGPDTASDAAEEARALYGLAANANVVRPWTDSDQAVLDNATRDLEEMGPAESLTIDVIETVQYRHDVPVTSALLDEAAQAGHGRTVEGVMAMLSEKDDHEAVLDVIHHGFVAVTDRSISTT